MSWRPLRWLAIGPRIALRGRHWLAFDRDAATAMGTEAQLALDLRIPLGRAVQLGAIAAGGLGVGTSELNGYRRTRVGPSAFVAAVGAFRVASTASVLVRLGYTALRVELGEEAHAQLGGFTFTLGIEVRE